MALDPHATRDEDGRIWTTWIRYTAARASLVVACTADGAKPLTTVLAHGEWIAEPRIARFGSGGTYVVWEEGRLDGDERRIVGRRLRLWQDASLALGTPEIIESGAVLFPRIAETEPERIELVYVRTDEDGTQELVHRVREELDGDVAWSDPRTIDRAPGDAWGAELAAADDGRLHVVYDAFEDGAFRVHHTILEGGAVRASRAFPTGSPYQGFPSIALEPETGAAWIAWEEAEQFGELGGLRTARSLALVRVEKDDVRRVPPAALPTQDLRCDFPRVAATERGLLVTFRGLGPPFPPGAAANEGLSDHSPRAAVGRERQYIDPKARFYTSFWTRALVFDEGGAASVLELPATEGDNAATETLLVGDDLVVLVFASDRRSEAEPKPSRFESAIEGRWRVGRLELPETRGFPPLEPLQRKPGAGVDLDLVETVARPEEGERRVFFGDLHRHTSVSRCSGANDGTTLDTYRYARGPGRLDFLAVTDHFQHLTPWAWWRNLREVARFHTPGRLVAFVGVERAGRDRAHRNDIYSAAGAIPFDPKTWNDFPEQGAAVDSGRRISIPHMMGREESPWRWKYFQEGVHRLFEVYQGARGSYEGPRLPYQASDLDVPAASVARGLVRGSDFGFVAASDHGSSSAGLTGVHAEELTRRAVFEALAQRDAFAATDFARVEVELGDLRAGESGAVGEKDWLGVSARGFAPVAGVDVVKNGETVLFHPEVRVDAREVFVLTTRRWGPYPDRPMSVRGVGGARIESCRARRRGRHEAEIELEEGTVRFSKKRQPLDLVLTVSNAAEGALELAIGGESTRVPLGELGTGRSRMLDAPADRESLLRLGSTNAHPERSFSFEYADDSLFPGDTFYVRVLFEDGNVAWSSPIRVTEVTR